MESAQKAEPFGVICPINIHAKVHDNLGVEFPRYVILGACILHPRTRRCKQEINRGLLLPCNAVVYGSDGCWAGIVDAADDAIRY